MIVLEIGCGMFPGPRFDNAAEFYAVDSNPSLLMGKPINVNDIDIAYGDATDLRGFDNGSMDVVLAKNVFGDPFLNLVGDERTKFQELGMYGSSLGTSISKYRKASRDVKQGALAEAERVLTDQGRLIVVETYTPIIAEEFFDSINFKLGRLVIEQAKLEDVAPTNYTKHHSDLYPVAWVGTKTPVN